MLCLLFLMALLGGHALGGAGHAKASGLTVELYALEPRQAFWDGSPRPFLCLARARTDRQCYALFPRIAALARIRLANGGSIERSDRIWTELPSGYRFTLASMGYRGIDLVDSSRNLTWHLELPNGDSRLSQGEAVRDWIDVAGVDFPWDAPSYIGGPDLSDRNLIRYPPRPGRAPVKRVDISDRQKQAILAEIDDWNRSGGGKGFAGVNMIAFRVLRELGHSAKSAKIAADRFYPVERGAVP